MKQPYAYDQVRVVKDSHSGYWRSGDLSGLISRDRPCGCQEESQGLGGLSIAEWRLLRAKKPHESGCKGIGGYTRGYFLAIF